MTQPTTVEIGKMTNGKLRALYADLFGKPTKNRNNIALRKKCILKIAAMVPATSRKINGAKPGKPRPSKSKHTPESIGIGKVLRHGMRSGEYPAGNTAECTVTGQGFVVVMVGPKGGRKDLGTHATLALAAAATGQKANGMTFWRLAPYPKHAKAAK